MGTKHSTEMSRSLGWDSVPWTFLPYCVDLSWLNVQRVSKEKDTGLTLEKHQKASRLDFSHSLEVDAKMILLPLFAAESSMCLTSMPHPSISQQAQLPSVSQSLGLTGYARGAWLSLV